jgi:protease II
MLQLKLEDPLSWMEPMKGARWKERVQQENAHFIRGLSAAQAAQAEKTPFTEPDDLTDIFTYGKIQVTPRGTFLLSWKHAEHVKHAGHVKHAEHAEHAAAQVFSEGDLVWAVEGDSEGKEEYHLSCYSGKEVLWTYNKSIGPFLAIKDGLCYLLEATSELRYGRLISLHAATGKQRQILYTEESLQHNLSLHIGENYGLFLISNNSGKQRLYHVKDTLCVPLSTESISFWPVGNGMDDEPCYFSRAKFSDPWTARGKTLRLFMIPRHLREFGLEAVSLVNRWLVTSARGVREIWQLRGSVSPICVAKIVGNCYVNPYNLWHAEPLTCYFTVPGETATLCKLSRHGMDMKRGSIYAYHEVRSVKGIPYVLVKGKGKQKALLVIVYGGYGIPTKLDTGRWKPYLESGWTLVFALVRGGGDMGDAWAEAGRRHMKLQSIEDTEYVICASQVITGISAKRTCIYGRSAGGYIIGAIISRYPHGDLIGAAYVEVPYVDVLKTTSNPNLPLTVLEYDEFGNPRQRIQDLETLLRVSPVDSLPADGAPGVFVVARTSTNDREVLAYESVKWITRLRGYPIPQKKSVEKFLYITDGYGHFVNGDLGAKQKAEDFLLLQKGIGLLQ